MDKKYNKIWELATPYLKRGLMKDFVIHTQGVVKAMELILQGEGGDPRIMIPAAILHDVGFSRVEPELQTNTDLEKKREAQRQHLAFAKDIIEEILKKAGYSTEEIGKAVEIVQAHKFQDPEDSEKRMLIDADNLSDTFKEQFESDVRAYNSTPAKVYEFRTYNTYYTKTAQSVAGKEMADRKRDIDQ